MLIRNARDNHGHSIELRIGSTIEAVSSRLAPLPGEEIVDARGGLLLPGLHDHHMHLMAYAASLNSVNCSAASLDSPTALLEHLSATLKQQRPSTLRGIGYHEGEHPLLSRWQLDEVSSEVPIRLQHRTGRLWIFNSAAIAKLGSDDFPEGAEREPSGALSGRFYHMDDWLQQHYPRRALNLSRASEQLAAFGITGLTDAGPDNDASTRELIERAQQRGELKQRVTLMGRPELDFDSSPMLSLGPCKIYLKENDLPDFDELCALIASQHARQRPVAFHCVTAAELHLALAALDTVGSCGFDRIEHASLCDDEAIRIAAKLEVSVVSQPIFLAERGDRYLASIPDDGQPLLYRVKSFLQAGVPFAGSSDAPFASADPWKCMAAAVRRDSPSGVTLGQEEALSSGEALQLYLGEATDPGRQQRSLAIGKPADLVLLKDAVCNFASALPTVRTTWIGGVPVFNYPD